MGTRNYDLGTRDMKAAGRVALEEGMRSFSSIDTMADRWNLFIDYVREHQAIGRMELITPDVIIAYGETLADRVDEGELEAATAQNYVSAVNRVLEIARGDRHIAVSPISGVKPGAIRSHKYPHQQKLPEVYFNIYFK
jgi:hypothetical protein